VVKLKTLLLEEESRLNITIDDVETLIRSRWVNRDSISLLKTLEAFYYSDKEEEQGWAKDYLILLNRVMEHVLNIAKRLGVPHVSGGFIKSRLLDESEFRFKMEEFFPFPLYIAATPNADGDWAEIGIMIDKDGRVLEIHEGNDEASPETISMANKLVNPSGKKVRVYGMHGTKVVQQIESSEYLPTNLYVSPDRGHASRHWDNTDRSMFTGIVDINNLSQESEIDWKTMGNTKIEKFRWL
jgi:hypothetical protein